MRIFCTTIHAIDPLDGEIKIWGGPYIKAIDRAEAQKFVQENGLGYCAIDGELIAEIPCKEGTWEPDFSKMIDYEQPGLN